MSRNASYSRSLAIERGVIYIVCIVLCLMSILPFAVMFINATRDNYAIQQGMSLIPGDRQLAFTFIMVVLMIPTQVSMVGFFTFMFKLNLVNTYIPLIVPAIASPSLVFFMRQYMIAGLPLEILEAARIDGCSELRTFNTITMPMMKPALATQAIFTFVGSWNKLFEPTMLINSQNKYTMPMLVALLKSDRFRTDYGTVYLALSLTVLPLFVVYFALSKYIIAGVALGGVKE